MKKTAFVAIAGATVAANAQLTTILEYQTAPSTSTTTLAPSFEAAGVTGDLVEAGAGIAPASGGTYNWNGWADGGVSNTNAADALAEGEFWTWGFDNTGATPLDLDSFDIRLDRSGTGPNQFEITASVNAGAAISVLNFTWPGDDNFGVSFIGESLAALPVINPGDSVVFTLVAWGEDSGGASEFGTFDLETVDFGGNDPRAIRIYTPAPASAALLGLGGLFVARRRRA